MNLRGLCVFVSLWWVCASAHAQILKAHVPSFTTSQNPTGFVSVPGARLRVSPTGVNDDWVVLLSARLGSDSNTNSVEVRFRVNTVVHGTGGIQNTAAMKGASWQQFYLITGVATPQTVDVQIREKVGASIDARIDDLNIIAFRVPAGADLHYQENEPNQAVTGTAWNPYHALTVTPTGAGDYLILTAASTSEAPSNAGIHVRLNEPSVGDMPLDDDPGSPDRFFLNDRSPLQTFFLARRHSLLPGSHTYTIEARSGNSTNTQIEYQRILAMRVDAFENYEFDQDFAPTSTTSTTPIVKSSVTTAAPPGFRDYLVIQSLYAYGASSTTEERRVGFERDNVEQSSYAHVLDATAHRAPFAHFDVVTTDSSVVYENTFSSSSGAYTVNAKESVIHVLRFPTANPVPQIGLATAGGKEGGMSWGDFNEDGCLDLLVNTRDDELGSRIYLQNTSGGCAGTFTDVSSCLLTAPGATGARFRSALWGDVNNDGRLDLVRNAAAGVEAIEIYFNNGPGTSCAGSVPWTQFGTAGNPSQSIVLADLPGAYTDLNTESMGLIDYDADGDLDLVGNNNDEGILLFDNVAGTFTHTDSASVGLPGQASAQVSADYGALADVDMDGNVDVLQRIENGVDLYLNSGGSFAASAFDEVADGSDKGGAAFCDFDADGDFDLFWSEGPTSQVWEQTGFRSGSFTARGVPTVGPDASGVSCPDLDNDGDQDLIVTTNADDLMYRNDGAFTFTDITPSEFGAQDGQDSAYADYDQDGDVDVVINQAGQNTVWTNSTDNNSYLIVRALHDLGGSTRDAIGATIRLFDCDGNELAGMREVSGGRGHGSQDSAYVHFGLSAGNAATHVVAVRYVGGTTRLKALVPSGLGAYQLLTITNTDADDLAACPLAAVDLVSFGARGLDGAVELTWRTGSEVDNLGFHIFRSGDPDGPYERITDALVPGSGSSPEGGLYRYRDDGLSNGEIYYYTLEDVETSGARTRHGPVSVVPEPGTSAEADALSTYGEPHRNAFRVLKQTKREVVLELETHGFYLRPDASGAVRIDVPGLDDIFERAPVKRTSIAAVPGRGVRLDVLEARGVSTLEGVTLDDRGTIVTVANASGAVRLEARRRGPKNPVGRPRARIVDVAFAGAKKMAIVELAPLRWDATAGRWELTQRLVVRVRFRGRESVETGPSLRRALKRQRPVARLAVRDGGLYGIRYREFFTKGRRPLATTRLRLSRRGESVPYHVEPDPTRFGPGSMLYFVSDGASLNPYETRAVYELEHGVSGEQMAIRSSSASEDVEHYWHDERREENRLYQAALTSADDLWFWDYVLPTSRNTFTFHVSERVGNEGELSVRLHGASDAPHNVRIHVNGDVVGEGSFDGERSFHFEADVGAALRDGANELEVENTGSSSSFSALLVDAFRVSYPRATTAIDGALVGGWRTSGRARVRGVENARVVELPHTWVVPHPDASFDVTAGEHYRVVSETAVLRPDVLRVPRTSLRRRQRADYIAIGPRTFLSAAAPLLKARRRQGLRVRAVAIEDIFSEFGFGEAQPSAVRDFLAYAYHEWRAPSPRYVVLLGDGTYDYKDYLGTGVENQVPPHGVRSQSLWTVSDPILAAVHGDDALPDVALGRLPASSPEELADVVAKILEYERSSIRLGSSVWVVSDDADEGGDFARDAHKLMSGVLQATSPSGIQLGALDAVEARTALRDAFDEGASLVSYVGHGGIHLWADEALLESSDVSSFAPQPVQPIVTAANCLNGYFHFPFFDSLAETLLLARDRGAVAVVAPSGLSLNAASKQFHEALLTELLSGSNPRLGDALLKAQARYAEGGTFLELLTIYHLFGDPALQIAR